MDEYEFALIQALIHANDDMRIIIVGDDDQNIYEFRGSNSKYLRNLIEDYGAIYEMKKILSKSSIVALSNAFIASVSNRMKSSPIQAVQMNQELLKLLIISRAYGSGRNHVAKHINLERLVCLQAPTTGTTDAGHTYPKSIRAKLIQSNDGFKLTI